MYLKIKIKTQFDVVAGVVACLIGGEAYALVPALEEDMGQSVLTVSVKQRNRNMVG